MAIHILKLNHKYCDDVYLGKKEFEIRFNDRNFSVGDTVKFIPVDDNGNIIEHGVSKATYIITYILSDFVGLTDGYVAFGIFLDFN